MQKNLAKMLDNKKYLCYLILARMQESEVKKLTYKVNSIELRKCMIGRGYLTIEDLSQAASVNRNTIGDILKGKGRPSSAVIERIATALGLSGTDIGRIFFDSDLA